MSLDPRRTFEASVSQVTFERGGEIVLRIKPREPMVDIPTLGIGDIVSIQRTSRSIHDKPKKAAATS